MVQSNATAVLMETGRAVSTMDQLRINVPDKKQYSEDLGTFLDTIATATGRATFYNSKEEQERAEVAAHEAMFKYDRSVYAALLCLPGTTDRAKQHGLIRLLADRDNGGSMNLSPDTITKMEDRVMATIVDDITVPRMLKAFIMLKDGKINNARARRIVLRSVLKGKGLEIRAVKYRSKFAEILRHVFGRKKASVLRSILERPQGTWERHEMKFVKDQIGRYARFTDADVLHVSVAYALGSDSDYVRLNQSTPLIKAMFDARVNINQGTKLPFEVLEGIRSTYHPNIPSAQVLELTKSTLTEGQKINMQAKAKRAGVEVKFDPLKQDMTKLYIYAYECGMTAEIRAALNTKAQDAANMMPFRYGKVGVIMDCSLSMFGSDTQKLRPMAVGLSTRDTLVNAADEAVVEYVGGVEEDGLVRPQGDTSLAEALVNVLIEEPDAVFVISDGYENAPAGRFGETVERIRAMGIETPIVQLSPVASADATEAGLRQLSRETQTVPVSKPEAMTSNMLRTMVVSDPILATSALMKIAIDKNRLIGMNDIKKLEG